MEIYFKIKEVLDVNDLENLQRIQTGFVKNVRKLKN